MRSFGKMPSIPVSLRALERSLIVVEEIAQFLNQFRKLLTIFLFDDLLTKGLHAVSFVRGHFGPHVQRLCTKNRSRRAYGVKPQRPRKVAGISRKLHLQRFQSLRCRTVLRRELLPWRPLPRDSWAGRWFRGTAAGDWRRRRLRQLQRERGLRSLWRVY